MAPESFTEHAEAPRVDSNTEDQMPRVGTTAASEVAHDLTTADKPTAHKMPTAPNGMPTTADKMPATDDKLHAATMEITALVEQNRQLERRLVAIEEATRGYNALTNAKLARMHDEAHKYYGTLYTLLRHVIEQKEKKPNPKVEEKIATLAEEIDKLRGSMQNIALGQESTIDTYPPPRAARRLPHVAGQLYTHHRRHTGAFAIGQLPAAAGRVELLCVACAVHSRKPTPAARGLPTDSRTRAATG